MGRRLTALGLIVTANFLGGCVRHGQVEVEQLPVKRVVVYRNGVAYFERNGKVEGEEVKFRLREENVGDFLATLAILEQGGSTVRAASFPVELDEGEEGAVDPSLQTALDAWEGKKPPKRPGLREVRLELDGKEHDLTVGYLAETPVWRPSYRLVVGTGGQAELQAWGIVQNQSGEDWKDVQIALVAGAPIAFESTLGEPVIPRRPIVTDSGEVIAAVPDSATTLAQEESAPAPTAAPAMEAADGYYGVEQDDLASGSGKMAEAKAMPQARSAGAAKKASGRVAPAAPPAPMGGVGQIRDRSRLAQIAVQSGATRYDVPHTVTIPDQSATMVLLVSKTIPGEAVHLFSPDPGVPESSRHPFRVVRFTNASGGLLEKGPIAVFESGAFLGQGLVEPLPDGAKATVPFALIRGLAVDIEYRSDYRDSRLYSLIGGTLTIEQDYAQITIYHVQNGESEDANLWVKHPRNSQAKLFAPPKGTEEDLASATALVPVFVKKRAKADLTLEERYPMQRQVDIGSSEARAALEDYLKSPGLSSNEATTIRSILSLSKKLEEGADRERAFVSEQAELEKAARETRLSIEAIEKNPKAADLRAQLTERLRRTTARLDELTKLLIELRLGVTEDEVRLRSAVQGLSVLPPDHRPR